MDAILNLIPGLVRIRKPVSEIVVSVPGNNWLRMIGSDGTLIIFEAATGMSSNGAGDGRNWSRDR